MLWCVFLPNLQQLTTLLYTSSCSKVSDKIQLMSLKGMKREKLLHNICIASRRLFYNPENDIVNNFSSGHKSDPGWKF